MSETKTARSTQAESLTAAVTKLSFTKLDQLKTSVEDLKKVASDTTNLKTAYKTFSEGTNNSIQVLSAKIKTIEDKLTEIETKLSDLVEALA